MLWGRAISFLLGPAGKVIMISLAFVGWTMYQRHDATSTCEAAELRKELIESQRQLEIATQIAEDARARADATETEMAETERLYDELSTDLKARPDAACPLSPDTRQRLLRIK